MKNMKHHIAAVFMAVVLVFGGAVSSQAASTGPYASVEFDWTTFTVNLLNLSTYVPMAGVVVVPGQDLSTAQTLFEYTPSSAPDWTTGTFAEAFGSYAKGQTSTGSLYAYATVDSNGGWANSEAHRYGQIFVPSAGLLVASVKVQWDAWVDSGGPAQDAFVYGHLNLTRPDGFAGSGDLNKPFSNQAGSLQFGSGIDYLYATVFVPGSTYIDLSAMAGAEVSASAVPLPSAMLMLGSGLMMIMGIRRKK